MTSNWHFYISCCRVLQLALAEWLCENWEIDARAEQIVRGMKLYLLPTINPDGFASKTRENRYDNVIHLASLMLSQVLKTE